MKAIIFDTETTGITEPIEAVEAAWLHVSDPRSLEVLDEFDQRYKPSKRIELGALATHHIMDEELECCEPSASFVLPSDVCYIIGHNIDFDWRVAGSPSVKRICTLALSRQLWPGLDIHSQSAMLYHLDRNMAKFLLTNAHSALIDVTNCRRLMLHIMAKLPNVHTWEDLWNASEKARIPTIITFGKHKGTHLKELPCDYVGWLLRQADLDPYLRKALQDL